MNGILNFSNWANSTELNENVKAAKSFLIKRFADLHKINEITPEVEHKALQNKTYEAIREMLKGNDGYVYAFVRFAIIHKASISQLEELFRKIKEYSGSLNSLPMSIEEYSKQETVNGVNPFEALMDQFHDMEQRKKYRWIIDKVNGDLRRSIKSLSPEEIDRLYKAAKLIDEADEEAGDFTDPETGHTTNNRISLLRKSNAFKDGQAYLKWVEEMAEGVSNSDLNTKVSALRSLQPEAGIIYNKGGYLVMSIRTERAQKELCSVANWCINRGSWGAYGGKSGYLQYNIFNFNLPVTNPRHIVGTTIGDSSKVTNSHDKNDLDVRKSSDPVQHFTALGYPADLVKTIIDSIPTESTIKQIISDLNINTAKPMDLLLSLVKSTYKIDLDVEHSIRNVIVGIVRDQLSKKISRKEILELYNKFGVLSTFSARILNAILPDITDSEKAELINITDNMINSPGRGFRAILASVGRSKYPTVTKAVDDYEKTKAIIISGEAISSSDN